MTPRTEDVVLDLARSCGDEAARDALKVLDEGERALRVELAPFDGLDGFDLETAVAETTVHILRYVRGVVESNSYALDPVTTNIRARARNIRHERARRTYLRTAERFAFRAALRAIRYRPPST